MPPPYSVTPNTGSASTTLGYTNLPDSLTSSFTAPLAAHLQSLPGRMENTAQTRSTQQAAFDLELITLLVPHVESFLSDLGRMPRRPPIAELTLVPATAVPRVWTMAGADERRQEGDILRVVRVEEQGDKMGNGDAKNPVQLSGNSPGSLSTSRSTRSVLDDPMPNLAGGRTSSGWVGEAGDETLPGETYDEALWWWQDESMARRLAAYLQPKPQPNLERKQVHMAVEKAKETKKSSWSWGRKRSTESSSAPLPLASASSQGDRAEASADNSSDKPESKVSMVVRADEVTFRRENDFGLWESLTGWGLVVVVRIRK